VSHDRAAPLDSNEINEVQAAELRLTAKNKILVVYEKPVILYQDFKAVE
jgi:hypothetical protein